MSVPLPHWGISGLLSRFSIVRRVVKADHCTQCSACVRLCPTRAIDSSHVEKTSNAECILCGMCTDRQRAGCSAFTISRPDFKSTGPDLSRRHLVAGVAAGAALVPVYRATALIRHDGKGRMIRPPGALPEEQFLARCIGCGECMKACPTKAIQPCVTENGLSRIFTPRIVPRIGGCEEKCHLCGHVCPTGALRPLTYDEKRFVKIGTVVLDRHRCLAWSQNKECVVCDEVCPYNAIEVRTIETTKGPFRVPVVNEDLCLGCGMCEKECPIANQAAIVVYQFGENRRASGPYLMDWQRERVLRERHRTNSAIGPGTDVESGPASQSAADSSESTLPPGFVSE